METRKAEKERIMSQYTCFVISPIWKEGTELYQRYKDLLELIIIPALERYDGLEVIRGDHCIREAKIDTSVIEKVQNADLCICDITEPNPNVFYELGRRDETGKPILLLKQAESGELPVDIATRRYVKYNWDARSVHETQKQIRAFVEPLLEKGFPAETPDAGNSELEKKVDSVLSIVMTLTESAKTEPLPLPGADTGRTELDEKLDRVLATVTRLMETAGTEPAESRRAGEQAVSSGGQETTREAAAAEELSEEETAAETDPQEQLLGKLREMIRTQNCEEAVLTNALVARVCTMIRMQNYKGAEEIFLNLKPRVDDSRNQILLETLLGQIGAAAGAGSEAAGDLLLKCSDAFMQRPDIDFDSKLFCVRQLVSYLIRAQKVQEHLERLQGFFAQMKRQTPEKNPDAMVEIYNQQNKVYYALYKATHSDAWLHKAIGELHTAEILNPKFLDDLQYSHAVIYYAFGVQGNAAARRMEDICLGKAYNCIRKCLEKDENSPKHLRKACQICIAMEKRKPPVREIPPVREMKNKLDALLTQYAKLDWAGAEALLRERMQKN